MTNDIIKDLTAKRGRQVFELLTEFNRNAGWAGYFYQGIDAAALAQISHYDKTPQHGLHITAWNRKHSNLNPSEFIRLVTTEATYDAKVLGYADDGKNQAIAVTRPPVYMNGATPHITISWIKKGNPSASGYMQFSDDMPVSVPTHMREGQMKVIMQNNREMNLSTFRAALNTLERERMTEIGAKLDPQVKTTIDRHYDTMVWEDIKKLIVNGVDFNEELAKLYAQYRADTTDNNMPTISDIIDEKWAEDAAADKASDEEYNTPGD